MSEYIYLLPSEQIVELVRSQILSRRSTRIKINNVEKSKKSVIAADLNFLTDDIDIFCYTNPRENQEQLNNEAGKVVTIGIREPKNLILNSFWNSYHKNGSTLEIFISNQIKNKSLFLSTLYEDWSKISARCIFLPIDKKNNLDDSHSISLQLLNDSTKAALSCEPDLFEDMYSAMLLASAQPFLVRGRSIGDSVLEDSVVKRLTTAAILSRPFYEYSKKFNHAQLEACGAVSTIIPDLLKKFVGEWTIDAEIFLQDNSENTDFDLIKNALPFYKEDQHRKFTVPTNNFENSLPLTSEFSILTRILAAGVSSF